MVLTLAVQLAGERRTVFGERGRRCEELVAEETSKSPLESQVENNTCQCSSLELRERRNHRISHRFEVSAGKNKNLELGI